MSVVVYSLGVVYFTGFFLYLLIFKLFIFILLGSVVFRVNLVSALSVAIVVGLCYWIVFRLSGRSGWVEYGVAVVAALFLGLGTILWFYVTMVEIYAFNLMVIMWLLWWVI